MKNKIESCLQRIKDELSTKLEKLLPRISKDWWDEVVVANLTLSQSEIVQKRGYDRLNDLDLFSLLRVTYKSWYALCSVVNMPYASRQIIFKLMQIKNNTYTEEDKISVINEFCRVVLGRYDSVLNIEEKEEELLVEGNEKVREVTDVADNIKKDDIVYPVGTPSTRGVVISIDNVVGKERYKVFIDGALKFFFSGQIQKVVPSSDNNWVDLDTFLTNLAAYEIEKPSAGNLYSLNSARIDFVPYQFRPALKIIKSDEPRILIADSVGVGKTIEAGLIIKELSARSSINNILIICPKPLVAEKKWELEMRRFDEEFIPVDGPTLKEILNSTHRDASWPLGRSKVIIPYSILDRKVYQGDGRKKRGIKSYGLLDLDPAPHFDLVIIDEAHKIRNGSLEKDKAFEYKCVRYFCEHAKAVVMLTATPVQTRDDDLYTLLNLIRPDVVMDKDVFNEMSAPNKFIYEASCAARSANEGWQRSVEEALSGIEQTNWGKRVIVKNPLFNSILDQIRKPDLTREQRVKIISDIESLHSFNAWVNRTRRRDIENFCIRRPNTRLSRFSNEQRNLHDELLKFVCQALTLRHGGSKSIPFMTSTIRRQAASCIHGLAPYLKDVINNRISVLVDEPDFDIEEADFSKLQGLGVLQQANNLLSMAEALPEEDEKFETLLEIIENKNRETNNKVIVFSTFRHTLTYLENKLNKIKDELGKSVYRVTQINGDSTDEERRGLRSRFELPKANPDALDVLLFTEVGSEGLDYQFCDTLVNYDLPWNPMRIEQRIGRIDRRGQQHEVVHIHNLITEGTVDADIYDRCLSRIGIFERSVGECDVILGNIASEIKRIYESGLTRAEEQEKLRQLADNQIRKMQALERLENEERAFLGFNLSRYTSAKEIANAESLWLSQQNLQKLVERYLRSLSNDDRTGHIQGGGDLKNLQTNQTERDKLLADYVELKYPRTLASIAWKAYLTGNEPNRKVTFSSETASRDRRAFFITSSHPLVMQAAKKFASSNLVRVYLKATSDVVPAGRYAFSMYAWHYIGYHDSISVIPICENELLASELLSLIQVAETHSDIPNFHESEWEGLEEIHYQQWTEGVAQHKQEEENSARYKLESIASNYEHRTISLKKKIENANDERIKRMYASELLSAKSNYESKCENIKEKLGKADIHTHQVAEGIIEIENK